jgi:Flp pilus assembly protein TadB
VAHPADTLRRHGAKLSFRHDWRFILRGRPALRTIGLPLLIGAVIYLLLAQIPYVGLLLAIVSTLLGVGAAWLVWRDMRAAAG